VDEGDALAWGAGAIAAVCGIDPAVVRSDTPLVSLGVDRLAVYCVADALDDRCARAGLPPYDDRRLESAVTVGDLIAPLIAATDVTTAEGELP